MESPITAIVPPVNIFVCNGLAARDCLYSDSRLATSFPNVFATCTLDVLMMFDD